MNKLIKPNLCNIRESMNQVDRGPRSIAPSIRESIEKIEEQYQPQSADEMNRALEPMLKNFGDLDEVDLILLIGGGAHLLAKIAPAKLPECTIHMYVDEAPVYSNVCEFHRVAKHLSVISH